VSLVDPKTASVPWPEDALELVPPSLGKIGTPTSWAAERLSRCPILYGAAKGGTASLGLVARAYDHHIRQRRLTGVRHTPNFL
jgi:hypothetical protein